jgi:hypothetical protein
MAKFETIVRPVVFPNIRPPARVRAAELEGEDEAPHVIRGQSGGVTDLPRSWSVNTSRSKRREIKRRVDEVRVFKMDENGNVAEDVWIDMHLTNKIWYREPGRSGGINESSGAGTPGGGSGEFDSQVFLQRQQEKKNVRIRKTDIIIKNPAIA